MVELRSEILLSSVSEIAFYIRIFGTFNQILKQLTTFLVFLVSPDKFQS